MIAGGERLIDARRSVSRAWTLKLGAMLWGPL